MFKLIASGQTEPASEMPLAFKMLDDHVRHCVADAITSKDADDAREKTEELLATVQRFARTR